MRLYLMRHAEAVPREEFGSLDDRTRPLTSKGRLQAQQSARALIRLKITPQIIFTSDCLRSLQTADEFGRMFGNKIPRKALTELNPETLPTRTTAVVAAVGEYEHLLLVGHETHMSSWISHLLTGGFALKSVLKKAGIACLEFESLPVKPGGATLRWLMTAKQLAAVAGHKTAVTE